MNDPAPEIPTPPQPTNYSLSEADLDRIDDLAPTLKEAELRLLIKLRRLTRALPHEAIRISTTKLEAATGIAQSAVRRALRSLAGRGLITVRQATATQATAIMVNAFRPIQIAKGVPLRGTPTPASKEHTPCLFEADPVPTEGTPPTENTPLNAISAAVDIDAASLRLIESILSAKPSKSDPALITQFRGWLHGYMQRLGRDDNNRPLPNPHPPGDDIVAQFLAIAEPRRLGTLLDSLMLDKQTCQTYGWFLVVAIQRIHGIAVTEQKRARAALKLVRSSGREKDPEWQQQTLDAIASVAAAKKLR